ncbi:MAG: glycosyltransferase family 2 protein [Planctomycetota bacterium]|jgi:glycosyltransferase involved in cell wall biosynthesis
MQTIVLIPAYDERETLEDVVRRASQHTSLQIVVDDGSTDGSGDVLDTLCRDLPSLQKITHDRNLGMASALRSGFFKVNEWLAEGRVAAEDALVLMDADGQHLPEEIPAMAARLNEMGFDLLIGCRDFSVYPFYKRLGNRILSIWGRMLSGFPFADIECGFKAMRVRSVPLLLEYYSGYRYSCAQEIALISVRRGLKVGNDCPVRVPLYRRGARMRDFLPNILFSLAAFIRLRLKWKRRDLNINV